MEFTDIRIVGVKCMNRFALGRRSGLINPAWDNESLAADPERLGELATRAFVQRGGVERSVEMIIWLEMRGRAGAGRR